MSCMSWTRKIYRFDKLHGAKPKFYLVIHIIYLFEKKPGSITFSLEIISGVLTIFIFKLILYYI